VLFQPRLEHLPAARRAPEAIGPAEPF
jgi:hypothetical protein